MNDEELTRALIDVLHFGNWCYTRELIKSVQVFQEELAEKGVFIVGDSHDARDTSTSKEAQMPGLADHPVTFALYLAEQLRDPAIKAGYDTAAADDQDALGVNND